MTIFKPDPDPRAKEVNDDVPERVAAAVPHPVPEHDGGGLGALHLGPGQAAQQQPGHPHQHSHHTVTSLTADTVPSSYAEHTELTADTAPSSYAEHTELCTLDKIS